MTNRKVILISLLVTMFGVSGAMYGGVEQMDSILHFSYLVRTGERSKNKY